MSPMNTLRPSASLDPRRMPGTPGPPPRYWSVANPVNGGRVNSTRRVTSGCMSGSTPQSTVVRVRSWPPRRSKVTRPSMRWKGAAPSTSGSSASRAVMLSASPTNPRVLSTVTIGMFSTNVVCTWSRNPFITASVTSSTMTPRITPRPAKTVINDNSLEPGVSRNRPLMWETRLIEPSCRQRLPASAAGTAGHRESRGCR